MESITGFVHFTRDLQTFGNANFFAMKNRRKIYLNLAAIAHSHSEINQCHCHQKTGYDGSRESEVKVKSTMIVKSCTAVIFWQISQLQADRKDNSQIYCASRLDTHRLLPCSFFRKCRNSFFFNFLLKRMRHST